MATGIFFLACIITLTVGWLGIPFGLIFTPITLFNLYTAEKRLRPANAKLLLEIAKNKLEKGNLREAAVFIQESLWLDDKQSAKLPIDQIKSALSQASQPSLISQVVSLISGFTASWLLGFFIGLVDGVLSTPFNQLQDQVSILVIIFSYIPLVLMLYFGSFVLARFIRWMLERTLITSDLIGRSMAGFAALISFYAILTGNLFFFVQTSAGTAEGSLIEAIRINGLLLVHGGWLTIVGLIQQGSLADLLFVVLVVLGLMSFIWLGQDWANRTVRFLRALEQIKGNVHQNSGIWAAVSAVLIVGILFVILGLLFFPTQILVI